MSTKALLAGFAQLIADAGLGVWKPTGAYAAGDVAVVMAGMPETPARVIALAVYTPAADDPKSTDSVVAVQIRLRGTEDPSVVQDLNDALFDLFQGRHDTSIGGVPVVNLWRQSSLSLGQDQNRRWELSANWYLQVAWATTYRTD